MVAGDEPGEDALEAGGGVVPEGELVPASVPEPAGAPERPRVDRWAHRRGEPRVFALFWTVYLMVATGLALASIGFRGQVPVDVYRPVVQMLLVTVGVGIVLIWPLVRLSQTRPAVSGAWAAMMDYFVVILPVQAIVWPQTWLTGWTLEVIGAIAVMLAGWGLLVAGLLAWALGPGTGRDERTRVAGSAVWMGVIIGLVAVGPLLGQAMGGIGPGASGQGGWGLTSPLTGVHALTTGLPVGGMGGSVMTGRWSMIVAPGAVGGAVWALAWAREVWRGLTGGR